MKRQTIDEFMVELEQDPDVAEELAVYKPSRDIAMLLVGIRKQLGLTQAAFAKRAGVSQSYVAQLESGIANPSIQKLSNLCRKNGVVLTFGASVAHHDSAWTEAHEQAALSR